MKLFQLYPKALAHLACKSPINSLVTQLIVKLPKNQFNSLDVAHSVPIEYTAFVNWRSA